MRTQASGVFVAVVDHYGDQWLCPTTPKGTLNGVDYFMETTTVLSAGCRSNTYCVEVPVREKQQIKSGGIIRVMITGSPSGSTLSLRRQPPPESGRPCHDITWLGSARFAHLWSYHNPITAYWGPCIHTTNRTFVNSVPLLYPTAAPGPTVKYNLYIFRLYNSWSGFLPNKSIYSF